MMLNKAPPPIMSHDIPSRLYSPWIFPIAWLASLWLKFLSFS